MENLKLTKAREDLETFILNMLKYADIHEEVYEKGLITQNEQQLLWDIVRGDPENGGHTAMKFVVRKVLESASNLSVLANILRKKNDDNKKWIASKIDDLLKEENKKSPNFFRKLFSRKKKAKNILENDTLPEGEIPNNQELQNKSEKSESCSLCNKSSTTDAKEYILCSGHMKFLLKAPKENNASFVLRESNANSYAGNWKSNVSKQHHHSYNPNYSEPQMQQKYTRSGSVNTKEDEISSFPNGQLNNDLHKCAESYNANSRMDENEIDGWPEKANEEQQSKESKELDGLSDLFEQTSINADRKSAVIYGLKDLNDENWDKREVISIFQKIQFQYADVTKVILQRLGGFPPLVSSYKRPLKITFEHPHICQAFIRSAYLMRKNGYIKNVVANFQKNGNRKRRGNPSYVNHDTKYRKFVEY